MPATTQKLERVARKRARDYGERVYIVEMDHEDSRRRCVVPSDYVDSPEFDAFSGEILGESFRGDPVEWYASPRA